MSTTITGCGTYLDKIRTRIEKLILQESRRRRLGRGERGTVSSDLQRSVDILRRHTEQISREMENADISALNSTQKQAFNTLKRCAESERRALLNFENTLKNRL